MAVKKNKKASSDELLEKILSSNFSRLSILFVVLAIACSALLLKYVEYQTNQQLQFSNVTKPKYWNVCEATWNPNGNLRTMNRVFERLGYDFVNASNGEDWDVLWSLEYPFDPSLTRLFDPIYNQPLKPHQRINHLPGIGALADKSFLSTRHRDLKYILPAFGTTQKNEFISYVAKNPTRKFVQKFIQNRGVKIVDKSEIDFTASYKIFQAFMDNPFLIDGRSFDFGVYVLISSVEPLRVYRYNTEMLVRFCPEPYHPFNASNIEQYVIYETHTSIEDLPSFKKISEKFGFSTKMMLENYLEANGHDVDKLWRKVDEIITTIIKRNEAYLVDESMKAFNSTKNFFELLRFDFLMDEAFSLYLMEVNLSPNITPTSEKHEKNAKVREKMVYDVVNLIGAGSRFDLMSRYDQNSSEMVSNLGNIAVNLSACVENNCETSCHKSQCDLCATCINNESLTNLHEAHREHSRRAGFKRVYPTKIHFNDKLIKKCTLQNKISVKWFQEKCHEDQEWC